MQTGQKFMLPFVLLTENKTSLSSYESGNSIISMCLWFMFALSLAGTLHVHLLPGVQLLIEGAIFHVL